ncbi:MAG: hypothetical protein LC790_01460 [Actinobacteria bacterium]|nr:hypothetical protein [Actinomycetota bacterium]
MEARPAITVVWGMEGLLGMLLLFGLSLFAVLVAISMADEARGAGWLGKLTADWRPPLLIAVGACGVLLVVANIPSLFRVQTVRLTVATLDVDYGDKSDTYIVKDISGREFQAQSDVWEQLLEGDRVTCRATDPVFVFEPTLLDCRRSRESAAPHASGARARARR